MDLEMYLWTALAVLLVFVIDLAAVMVGGIWLDRRGYFQRLGPEAQTTPAEILERRFAEGAITADEYHQRRAVVATGAQD